MNTRRLFAAAATASFAAPLPAQSADSVPTTPPAVFLERAYFSLGTPSTKHVLFEGQPTVHYFIFNTLTDPQWQAEGGLAWALPVSAVFQVRMTRDNVPLQNGEISSSEPVLTPSYHIGIRPQLFYLSRSGGGTHYLLGGFTGGLTHYSNGQHGCTFIGLTRDATGFCSVVNSTLAATNTANVVDGDFSTTYFSEAFDVRWAEQKGRFGAMLWQLSAGAEFQQDPLNFSPGGTNAAQAAQYGQRGLLTRVLAEGRLEGSFGGVGRIEADNYWRYGGGMQSAIHAGQLEESYVLDRVGHVGAFLREHWGFDYYNIHFQERQFFWSVGLMWEPGRLDHLHSCFKHTLPTSHGLTTSDRCGG